MLSEEPLVIVIFKPKIQVQIVQPTGWSLRPVEMDLQLFVREVVGVAMQFERGPSADGERVIEKRLKRDDKLLPGERTARAAVNPPCRLVEPARTHVVA